MLYYLSDRILLVRCSSVFVCDYFEPLLCHLACITGNVQLATRILSFSEFVIDFFFPGQGSSHEEKIAAVFASDVQDGNCAWFSAFLNVLAG